MAATCRQIAGDLLEAGPGLNDGDIALFAGMSSVGNQ
jgi:hypothetical protein